MTTVTGYGFHHQHRGGDLAEKLRRLDDRAFDKLGSAWRGWSTKAQDVGLLIATAGAVTAVVYSLH